MEEAAGFLLGLRLFWPSVGRVAAFPSWFKSFWFHVLDQTNVPAGGADGLRYQKTEAERILSLTALRNESGAGSDSI